MLEQMRGGKLPVAINDFVSALEDDFVCSAIKDMKLDSTFCRLFNDEKRVTKFMLVFEKPKNGDELILEACMFIRISIAWHGKSISFGGSCTHYNSKGEGDERVMTISEPACHKILNIAQIIRDEYAESTVSETV